MDPLYLVALFGVAVGVIAIVVEAVATVSRAGDSPRGEWYVVEAAREDRRQTALPFVGRERRRAEGALQPAPVPVVEEQRRSA